MKIHYSLYLNHTGYSAAAQDYVLAIHRVQPDVDIKCKFLNKTPVGVSLNRRNFFHSMRDDKDHIGRVKIFQSIPPRFFQADGAVSNIGFCVFETVTIPKDWVNRMNKMDLILTASEFNKGIFESNGVNKPIHVVPHCFDPQLFNRDVKPRGRYAKTTFFAIGQWKERKNWEILIKAFYQAFEKKDNVCLLIKTDRPETLTQRVQQIKKTSFRSKDTAPIFGEQQKLCTFEEIPELMRKGDIYISTSLGEGFGLPGLHAMALGMPVITTKFGGVLQYAKPEYCTYIQPHRYEKRASMDNIPQLRNGIWPVITSEEVAQRMREVWENPPVRKTENAYRYVHENFTYKSIGKQYCEIIKNAAYSKST